MISVIHSKCDCVGLEKNRQQWMSVTILIVVQLQSEMNRILSIRTDGRMITMRSMQFIKWMSRERESEAMTISFSFLFNAENALLISWSVPVGTSNLRALRCIISIITAFQLNRHLCANAKPMTSLFLLIPSETRAPSLCFCLLFFSQRRNWSLTFYWCCLVDRSMSVACAIGKL